MGIHIGYGPNGEIYIARVGSSHREYAAATLIDTQEGIDIIGDSSDIDAILPKFLGSRLGYMHADSGLRNLYRTAAGAKTG